MTDRDNIKATDCKTITNTKIEHTRHGIVRTEVRSEIKTDSKGKGRK